MLMVIIGILVIVATIYFLIKNVETRFVLIAAGLLMALIAGTPLAAFDAFSEKMVAGSLIQAILSVMGFAFVMKVTECDKHMINFVSGGVKKLGFLLIPGAVIATFLINIALPSAAGTAAAVGAVLIPLLIGVGVHPAIAGAAVLAGTYGSMLSPGLSHNAFIADIAGTDVMSVIGVHSTATIVSGLIGAVSLGVIAFIFKESKGYVSTEHSIQGVEKINYLSAIVPIVPVIILILGNTVFPALEMGIPHAMLIGIIVAMIVSRKNVQTISKSFFDGMGKSYGDIMGIIIAASVFVGGLNAIGLVDAFIESMINTPAIVNVAATFGPFLLGVVSGSGDAAAFAFNEAVTPFASQFGIESVNMGSIAALGGALGRTMSPICGATVVCAGIAKVNPMELAKRNAPGMIIAAIVSMFILL